MNNGKAAGGIFGTIISAVGVGLTAEEVERILSIICSVVGLVITLLSVVIIPVIKHFINAKKNDGKITIDEIEEGVKIAEDGIEKVKKDSDSNKK